MVARKRREKAVLRRLSLLLVAIVLLASCDGAVYHRFEQVDSAGWAASDTLSFMYDGSSVAAGAAVAVAVQLRYAAAYEYKNMCVCVETSKAGGGLLSVDTLCCAIYDDDGRRLGAIAGTMYQNGSDAVVLPAVCSDTLCLKVSHIMDGDTLRGVYDVGVKLTMVKR